MLGNKSAAFLLTVVESVCSVAVNRNSKMKIFFLNVIKSISRSSSNCALALLSAALGLILCASEVVCPAAEAQTSNASLSAAEAIGWQSLGAVLAPTWDGKTLLFHNGQGS